MMEIWVLVKAWLIAEAVWFGPLTGAVFGFLGWSKGWFSRAKPVELAPATVEQLKPATPKTATTLTTAEFIRLRRELKDDLQDELTRADEAEKAQLTARIAELESQIANPEQSLADAQKRIADLEALLDRTGNTIGGDRIAEAKAALEQGDYSKATDIFEEIKARNQIAQLETARAEYGLGEIAEAEVRWADAAESYQAAAKLDPCYRTLMKAHEFTHWAGDYAAALPFGEAAVIAAESEGDQPNLAMGKNDLGLTYWRLGNLIEAKTLLSDALEIDRGTIGEEHPNYAIHINSLASVIEAQGKLDEAERLYRQALEIDRATIGEEHPDYAIHLGNLALVLEKQGKLDEAEPLYRQALEIDRATIGEAHPDYAIRLTNLAGLLAKQGKYTEARAMFAQALTIYQAALPADHPHIAITQAHIAKLPPE